MRQVDVHRSAEYGGHFTLGGDGELMRSGDAGQRSAQPIEHFEPSLANPRRLHLSSQPGGKRSDEEGHHREDEQRHQVLDVADGERVVGGNEEEVEGQNRGDRGHHPRTQAPPHGSQDDRGRKTTALFASDNPAN